VTWVARIVLVEAEARDERPDARHDRRQHLGDVGRRWHGRRMKAKRPTSRAREPPVEHERVYVDVQIHRAAEVLKHRDAAAPGILDAVRLGPRAQMAFDGLVQDARNPSAQVVTPRQQVAQPRREREHPLSYRNAWEDVVDDARRVRRRARAPRC
jgi:hypothetical protein